MEEMEQGHHSCTLEAIHVSYAGDRVIEEYWDG